MCQKTLVRTLVKFVKFMHDNKQTTEEAKRRVIQAYSSCSVGTQVCGEDKLWLDSSIKA